MLYGSRVLSKGDIVEERYVVERELGRGGMSILYVVKAVGSDDKLVLKLPKHDVKHKYDLYCDSIRQEANVMAMLDHPQIVKFVEYIHKSNGLVMNYVEGKSLAEVYDCCKATNEEALDILKRLCDVISYMHGEGIIHRDICPKNILLGPNKVPILIDFGTAYNVHHDELVTANVSHGSYTPPELSQNGGHNNHNNNSRFPPPPPGHSNNNHNFPPPPPPGKVMARTKPTKANDIFSLGATLYFLLSSSSPPFLANDKDYLSLRRASIFSNLIQGSTQRHPQLRFRLRDVEVTLSGIEDIIRFKPLIKVINSQDPSVKPGTVFFLEKSKNRIGKSPQNDVYLPAKYVSSPKHAEIMNAAGSGDWVITDCDSHNGTFLNKARVISGKFKKLQDGDDIWLVYNPDKPREPYIHLEFISDKNKIQEFYEEINDLEITTSWDWNGNQLDLRSTVKNNSDLPWKNIVVDYVGAGELFTCDKDLNLKYDLMPGQERYHERKMTLKDAGSGGDFTVPMKVRVGGRLVRDEDLYFRYGESFRPSSGGLDAEVDRTIDGDKINVQLKLNNVSPYTHNRVSITLDIPEGLELLQPDSRVRDIPYLGSNESQAITFIMKAKRAMKAKIHFDISYHDHMGKKRRINAPVVDTGNIMPLIEPLEMREHEFMMSIKTLPRASRQIMYSDITIEKARSRLSDACSNLHCVGKYEDVNSFQLLYAGKPTKSPLSFLMLCGGWRKEDGTIEFRFDGYSIDPDIAEKFLQGQFESIDRAIRLEKAMLVTQVTYNVDIKDSVIYKSNIGEGGGDINLQDGVAFNTNK